MFWSYKELFFDEELTREIIDNICLFIPLGGILYRVFEIKKVMLYGLVLSIAIEVTQLITKLGVCEFDDILSNFIGIIVGCMLMVLFVKRVKYKKRNEKLG